MAVKAEGKVEEKVVKVMVVKPERLFIDGVMRSHASGPFELTESKAARYGKHLVLHNPSMDPKPIDPSEDPFTKRLQEQFALSAKDGNNRMETSGNDRD